MQRTRRPGFTLIELLVVIGIILILVAIVVIGLRHVNNTVARHETIAEMKLCSDMLKEYENVSGLVNIEGTANAPTVTLPPPWSFIANLPLFIDPTTPAQQVSGQPLPQSVSMLVESEFAVGTDRDMGDKTATARYTASAVQRTQAAMYLLLRDPKNRITISNIPAKRVLEAQQLQSGQPTAQNPIDAAVVLDGWGNPIVYVPRGGMRVLVSNAGGMQAFLIRSSATVFIGSGAPPLLSTNDHPFFASAGQDGVFTDVQNGTVDYASDNVYSFQD